MGQAQPPACPPAALLLVKNNCLYTPLSLAFPLLSRISLYEITFLRPGQMTSITLVLGEPAKGQQQG